MIFRKAEGRFWEIDVARGVAVVLMVLFHLLYDLNFFSLIHLDLYSGPFFFFAYGTAFTFVFLVGVSLSLKYQKIRLRSTGSLRFLPFLFRGMRILMLGFIVTVVTFLLFPERFIIFGILHFVGISIILSYPFQGFVKSNYVIGLLCIILGIYLRMFIVDFPWFIPFGLVPRTFSTFDYFPLLPWFGVVLIGMSFGNIFYVSAKRRYLMKDYSSNSFISLLCLLGRNSLLVYFLHQPMLFALIYLLV